MNVPAGVSLIPSATSSHFSRPDVSVPRVPRERQSIPARWHDGIKLARRASRALALSQPHCRRRAERAQNENSSSRSRPKSRRCEDDNARAVSRSIYNQGCLENPVVACVYVAPQLASFAARRGCIFFEFVEPATVLSRHTGDVLPWQNASAAASRRSCRRHLRCFAA